MQNAISRYFILGIFVAYLSTSGCMPPTEKKNTPPPGKEQSNKDTAEAISRLENAKNEARDAQYRVEALAEALSNQLKIAANRIEQLEKAILETPGERDMAPADSVFECRELPKLSDADRQKVQKAATLISQGSLDDALLMIAALKDAEVAAHLLAFHIVDFLGSARQYAIAEELLAKAQNAQTIDFGYSRLAAAYMALGEKAKAQMLLERSGGKRKPRTFGPVDQHQVKPPPAA